MGKVRKKKKIRHKNCASIACNKIHWKFVDKKKFTIFGRMIKTFEMHHAKHKHEYLIISNEFQWDQRNQW